MVFKTELIKFVMREAIGGKGLREFEVKPPKEEGKRENREEVKRSTSRIRRKGSNVGNKLLPPKSPSNRYRSPSRHRTK